MSRHALVIAISEYQQEPFQPLHNSISDAETLAQVLERYGNYQVKRVPACWSAERNRYEMASRPVSSLELGEELKTFLLQKADQGEALIYFMGHGITLADNLGQLKGYLVTSDCTVEVNDQRPVNQQKGTSLDSLNHLIDTSNLSSLVLFLDCSHGGVFLERNLVNQALTVFSSQKDYYLMTVCQEFETTDRGKPHSLFTKALLKGLSVDNAGEDGRISGDRLFDFISKTLRGSGYEPIYIGWGQPITLVTYPVRSDSDPAIRAESSHPTPDLRADQSVSNVFNITDSTITNLTGSGSINYREASDSVRNQTSTPLDPQPLTSSSNKVFPPRRDSDTLQSSTSSFPGPRKSAKHIEVFFSYAHQDETLRDELEKHLSNLKRQGIITAWHDREISAGTEWAGEINTHLNTAKIILLLISPDFMASDYCFDIEMQRAMERHKAGEACVIPIILRPVDWGGSCFSTLQALPKNAKPVTSWVNRDEAFLNVTQGIRKVVEQLFF